MESRGGFARDPPPPALMVLVRLMALLARLAPESLPSPAAWSSRSLRLTLWRSGLARGATESASSPLPPDTPPSVGTSDTRLSCDKEYLVEVESDSASGRRLLDLPLPLPAMELIRSSEKGDFNGDARGDVVFSVEEGEPTLPFRDPFEPACAPIASYDERERGSVSLASGGCGDGHDAVRPAQHPKSAAKAGSFGDPRNRGTGGRGIGRRAERTETETCALEVPSEVED